MATARAAPLPSLTLFGGFASTVCWPLGAFLVETFDWRVTCLVYAGLHLFVALPLQRLMPRDAARVVAETPPPSVTTAAGAAAPNERALFILLALVLTIAAGVGAVVVVHLLILLQARGLDFAAAVVLGTLFGPAQVGARIVERLFGQHYHPVWTMIAASAGMAIGLAMLFGGFPVLALAILVYAAGYGISWIARGTLPLALFDAARYPTLMGRLAFPSLIVQALAPSLGALLLEHRGADTTLATLTALAVINVALVGALWWLGRARR
jgi:predicted MFS family arabinose efflux permease